MHMHDSDTPDNSAPDNSTAKTKSPPVTNVTADQKAAIHRSLEYFFIADALAMPVHWFYRPADILATFPPHGITRMEAAPHPHPSSVMPLHSTQKGGRRNSHQSARASNSDTTPRDIVGDVILVGKRALWEAPGTHYHHGMPAGENTLNAWCARALMEFVSDNNYSTERWLEHYIAFMTADPPQHPDTYAESYHRGFFANLEKGLPPLKCGAVTHDTPSMGALVTVAPLAFSLLATHSLDDVIRHCQQHVWSTHPANELMPVVAAYVTLLERLLNRSATEPVNPQWFVEAAQAVPGGNLQPFLSKPSISDHVVVGQHYSLACYITGSWPSVCYLAARYYDDPTTGLLRNANLGGENAHRGAVLGSLLGLCATTSDNDLFQQLNHKASLQSLFQRFTDSF